MDGEKDGAKGTAEQATGVAQPQEQEGREQAAQVTTPAPTPEDDYKALLAKRDERIAELEASVAEAAKTAETAEALRAEMDKLRAEGEAQRVEFELALAGAKNVKAAKALLADRGGDVEKLKAAEPWLFGSTAAAPQGGTTGLEPAGAAGGDDTEMERWREIAGLSGEDEE